MKIAGQTGMTIKGRRFFTVFPAPSSSSPRTEEGEPRSLPRLPPTDSGSAADRLQEKLGENGERTPNGFAQTMVIELRLWVVGGAGQMREGSRAREVAAPEIRSPATPGRTERRGRQLSSAKRSANPPRLPSVSCTTSCAQ